MSYQHPQLGIALGWKYNHQQGMRTVDGVLVDFPGIWPTDAEQAQAVSDYQAYQVSSQCKDDELMAFLATNGGKALRAVALVGIDKGVWTLAELKAKYRSL